jgi:hypothetical protein
VDDRRGRAAAFVADAYPEWAHDGTVGLEWTRTPTDHSTAVRRFLDGFATWVAQQLETAVEARPIHSVEAPNEHRE